MSEQTQRPWFFNLIKDGDTAVVRLLHTTTATIESADVHRIEVGGKKRGVKCLGESCPLCANGNKKDHRIYVHLWDYTDNKEKVWDRTDKILPQFATLEKSWSPLSSAVIRITRKGDQFPRYYIEVLNPASYSNVDNALVDKQVAKLYSMSRNAEEIKTFIATGNFPERKEYIPKDEYKRMKETESAPQITPSSAIPTTQPTNTTSDDDPFVY